MAGLSSKPLLWRAVGFLLFWAALIGWAHKPVEREMQYRLHDNRIRSSFVQFDPVQFIADFRAINS